MKAPDDAKRLADALVDGEVSLGDLRRSHELDPILVGRLCVAFPDRFQSFDQLGRPYIRMREPLSAVDQKLFDLLKGARAGLSLPKLWTSHKIPTETSQSFAERFSDVSIILEKKTREGKLREFLMLKSALPVQQGIAVNANDPGASGVSGVAPEVPEPPALPYTAFEGSVPCICTPEPSNAPGEAPAKPVVPISSELAANAAKLNLYLTNPVCARHDFWLADMGIYPDVIEEIISAFPNVYEVDRNPDRGATWQFRIWLVKKPELTPEHTITVQKPAHQPAAPFPVSDAELAKMRFKPASPGMVNRRGSNLHPLSIQHRARHPIVILPEG